MDFIYVKFFLLVLIFKPPDIFVSCEEVFGQLIPLKTPINEVSDKFLSFTIDPQYLFLNNKDLTSEESVSMANSLSPAYIRIAGPSTPYMKFENSSIELEPQLINNTPKDSDNERKLVIALKQWISFAQWANISNFIPVFALNSEQRTTESGLWDPNEAIQMMSEAENEDIGECVWQLGNKCTRGIYQYLNDLQTLKIIIDTFESGKSGKWKVTGSEIMNCLDPFPEETLKEYLMRATNITDIAFLSGNTTSNQLHLLNFNDEGQVRSKLKKTNTDLWMAEAASDLEDYEEEFEAMSWLNSLGNAARDGYSVYFKELNEKEFKGPTLSYYMSLLHKNLVGRKVLKVKLDKTENGSKDDITLFAHCATLKQIPIPGAITLFGANRKSEHAKISVKLPGVEGGEVMQYILNLDRNENIMVNSMPMFHDGEIRPSIKKLWLGKKTMLTLPPKSFGFWVLVNAKMPVCDMGPDQTPDTAKSLEDDDIVHDILFKDMLVSNRKKRATTFIKDDRSDQKSSEDYAEYEEIEDRETANKIVKMTNSNHGRKNMAQILAKLAAFKQIAQSNDLNRMMKGIKQLFEIQFDKLRLNPRLENAVKELRGDTLDGQHIGRRNKRQVKGFEIKALKAKLKPDVSENSVKPTKIDLLSKQANKSLKTNVEAAIEEIEPKIEEKPKGKLFGKYKSNFSENTLKSAKSNLSSKQVDKTVNADLKAVVEEVKPNIKEKPKVKLLGKSKPKVVAEIPKVVEKEKLSTEPVFGQVLKSRGYLGLRKKIVDRKAHLGVLKGKIKLRHLGRLRRSLSQSTESDLLNSQKRGKRSILNTLTKNNPTLGNLLMDSKLKEKTKDGLKIALPSLTGKINSMKKESEKQSQNEISSGDETKDNRIIKMTRSPYDDDEENNDHFDGISMTAKISNGGATLNMEEPLNQSLTFLTSIVDNVNYMATKLQKDLSRIFTLMAV